MSEFKVGDRVRILADSCIKGCEADVVEIEQDRVTISCGVFSGCFNKDRLALVKSQDQQKIEQLEQRIEKLEEIVNKQNNCQNKQNNSQNCKISAKNEEIISKSQLLTEDERVILRNLEDDYKWIVRDETGWLTIHEMYPYINIHHRWVSNGDSNFFDLFNHIFQFIKWGDKPYNIEELLKGECKNE